MDQREVKKNSFDLFHWSRHLGRLNLAHPQKSKHANQPKYVANELIEREIS